MMEFERGKDVKQALGVGLNSSSPWNYPEKGRRFFVRFRLRESRPDFYPLQRLEREGKPVIAISRGPKEWKVKNDIGVVVCDIEGIGPEPFFAVWDLEEKIWEIS